MKNASTTGNKDLPSSDEMLNMLDDVLAMAARAGAEAADAMMSVGSSLAVAWREGKLETLESSESSGLGLRVLIGKKQAMTSSSDCSPKAVAEAVERAVAMAKLAPEDEFCGLADPEEIARAWPQMEMADDFALDAEKFVEMAREAEDALLSVRGVSKCEGADAGGGRSVSALATSVGFRGGQIRTGYSVGASALAGSGTEMERDSDGESRVFMADMPKAAAIGLKAGERVVKLMGSRKMPTCRVPVVFDPRESNGILGCLSGAISGSSVARGTSFLKDKLGQRIFPHGVHVTDDPFRPRGLRSRVFDGEGLPQRRRRIVEDGTLTTWFLDLRSARQLKMKSTGHAGRSGGLPYPSPSNLYFEAGKISLKDMLSSVNEGFYVTETMGSGVNGVTGDYSLAARGFWISKGELAFPVSEMTIAGNLKDMFMNMALADDLEFRRGLNAPTMRIDGMTVAGS